MGAIRQRAGAWHGLTLVASFAAVWVAWPLLSWPWFLLLPLLAYAAIVLAIPFLRRTAPPLVVGRLAGAPLVSAIVLSLATSIVLASYQSIAKPDLTELAARLPISWFGYFAIAGICFSVLNAVLEEVAFRGVLWGAVADEWNDGVALVVSSLIFGVLHLHGYPPGASGAVLAGLYGFALGLLRRWTGGLGLAIACHICADATIFTLLVSAGEVAG